MKTYLDSEKAEVRIEIVPLIDVVFCVLVFFILGAVRLTAPDGIGVDLPQAKTGEPQLEQTITVRMEASGLLSIDGQPIYDATRLKQQLGSYLIQNPSGLIVLEAAKQARYEQVIQVVDLLRQVGGNRVALETIQPNPASPEPGLPSPLPAPPGTGLPPAPTVPGAIPTNPGQAPAVPPASGLPGQPAPGTAAPDLNQDSGDNDELEDELEDEE